MIQTISKLVALAESGNEIRALRFEPNYSPEESVSLLIQKCHPFYISLSTARNIAATSWGKFQIMGFNIYGLGYRGTIFDFWNDESLQYFYFNEFLKSNGINYTLDQIISNKDLMKNFAEKYNGSLTYSDTLTKIYNENSSI